jgi:DNA-binding NtrC family response regulator
MPPSRRIVSILILEDEEAARSLLVDTLTQAGHAVDAVPDALSGLAKLEKVSFDVVLLTDLALPERSGLVVARSVKRVQPETPVILITGWGIFSIRAGCVSMASISCSSSRSSATPCSRW